MKRLTTVLKATFGGFLILNLLLSIIFYIDCVIEGKEMPWEYLGFVSLYGIFVSVIFGYLDSPILEKRILIGITIGSIAALITSFFIESQILRMQSLYVFFGIVIGRKFVLIIDILLGKEI
jgi:hypothetical protein